MKYKIAILIFSFIYNVWISLLIFSDLKNNQKSSFESSALFSSFVFMGGLLLIACIGGILGIYDDKNK